MPHCQNLPRQDCQSHERVCSLNLCSLNLPQCMSKRKQAHTEPYRSNTIKTRPSLSLWQAHAMAHVSGPQQNICGIHTVNETGTPGYGPAPDRMGSCFNLGVKSVVRCLNCNPTICWALLYGDAPYGASVWRMRVMLPLLAVQVPTARRTLTATKGCNASCT